MLGPPLPRLPQQIHVIILQILLCPSFESARQCLIFSCSVPDLIAITGGWLPDEVTGDIMGRVSHDAEPLKLLRDQNGFAVALDSVRSLYQQHPEDRFHAKRLFMLQDAISDSCAEMNAAFKARGQTDDRSHFVRTFLARFHTIFTLNQDLLLERLCKPQGLNQ